MTKQREIKFRAWLKGTKAMLLWDDLQMEELWAILHNESQGYILLQFTGLHDKNNKEIYEGDIVGKDDWGLPVEFHDGCFTISNAQPLIEWLGTRGRRQEDTFVIGNIYENPELLK